MNGAVDESVFVDLADRAEPRVKPVLDVFSRDDADLGRQDAVERSRERCGIDGGVQSEGRDLRERVDARVGAAGAVDDDRSAFNRNECIFEQTLNRDARVLPLPADERRAVVLNRDFQIAHQVARGTRLHDRDALRAERAGLGLIGRHIETTRENSGRFRRCGSLPRSTIDAAPATTAPAAVATSLVSRVDPPVVITSSTTRTRSPDASENRGEA